MSNLPITATFTFRGRVNSVSELPMDAAIYDVYAVENLTYALLPQGWVNTNEIYETTYTREEVIAMLTEIQLELDEMKITKVRSAGFAPYSKDPFRRGVNCSKEIIQQKINVLKGEETDGKREDL